MVKYKNQCEEVQLEEDVWIYSKVLSVGVRFQPRSLLDWSHFSARVFKGCLEKEAGYFQAMDV